MTSETASLTRADTGRPASANPMGDKLFRGLTCGAAVLVLTLLLGILLSLAYGSLPVLSKMGGAFFTSVTWNPVTERFGLIAPVYGTLVTSVIAILFGVPISFGIAMFLTELAPDWARRPVGIAIELLAAVPSIIYGMWGLFVFAPFYAEYVQPLLTDWLGPIPLLGALFDGPPMGIGMSTAGMILAVMIVPFVAATMRDVFLTVPPMVRESAYGIGCTTWEVVWHIVLPYTRASVIGGIMLGLGRALGETMAVTFVIGNAHDISPSLFLPGATISSTVANEFAEATGDIYPSALVALGFSLFVISFVVLAAARLMLRRLEARAAA